MSKTFLQWCVLLCAAAFWEIPGNSSNNADKKTGFIQMSLNCCLCNCWKVFEVVMYSFHLSTGRKISILAAYRFASNLKNFNHVLCFQFVKRMFLTFVSALQSRWSRVPYGFLGEVVLWDEERIQRNNASACTVSSEFVSEWQLSGGKLGLCVCVCVYCGICYDLKMDFFFNRNFLVVYIPVYYGLWIVRDIKENCDACYFKSLYLSSFCFGETRKKKNCIFLILPKIFLEKVLSETEACFLI